ncbi:MAG: DUF1304 domain-containing protein [Acinetobacter sp.]|nr:DUF1304 domain-containing protein [Acinetobacter sp.]
MNDLSIPLSTLAIIFATIVAIEHLFIMCLEMFFIRSAMAKRAFGLSREFLQQKQTQVLFANLGLYNGFVGIGILWSLFLVPSDFQRLSTLFFVGFVIVAACFGAITSSKKILLTQGLPAIVAMLCICF